MVPTLDHYRSYASKAQQHLVNRFLSSRFSGRSWDRIWFDDEDETSVKSQAAWKQHLPQIHPFWLVVCLPMMISAEPLDDRNLWQADILHHGPDDGQTRRLGGEGINLIGLWEP